MPDSAVINRKYKDSLFRKLFNNEEALLSLEEAVRKAMDTCIQNGVLSEFLMLYREEVFHMILEEYDEALHKKTEEEYWTEVGREQGHAEGLTAGHQQAIEILKLHHQGKTREEIAAIRGVSPDYVNSLLDVL